MVALGVGEGRLLVVRVVGVELGGGPERRAGVTLDQITGLDLLRRVVALVGVRRVGLGRDDRVLEVSRLELGP